MLIPQTGKSITLYQASPDVISRQVGNSLMIIHMITNEVWQLDTTARSIWQLTQKARSSAQICEKLTEAYQVSTDEIEDDVNSILAMLVDETILVALQREKAC